MPGSSQSQSEAQGLMAWDISRGFKGFLVEVPGFRDWGLGLGFLGASWGLRLSSFGFQREMLRRLPRHALQSQSLEALGLQEQRGIIAATAALPKLVDKNARRIKHRY